VNDTLIIEIIVKLKGIIKGEMNTGECGEIVDVSGDSSRHGKRGRNQDHGQHDVRRMESGDWFKMAKGILPKEEIAVNI
jgi:hypothetical protein